MKVPELSYYLVGDILLKQGVNQLFELGTELFLGIEQINGNDDADDEVHSQPDKGNGTFGDGLHNGGHLRKQRILKEAVQALVYGIDRLCDALVHFRIHSRRDMFIIKTDDAAVDAGKVRDHALDALDKLRYQKHEQAYDQKYEQHDGDQYGKCTQAFPEFLVGPDVFTALFQRCYEQLRFEKIKERSQNICDYAAENNSHKGMQYASDPGCKKIMKLRQK